MPATEPSSIVTGIYHDISMRLLIYYPNDRSQNMAVGRSLKGGLVGLEVLTHPHVSSLTMQPFLKQGNLYYII